MADFDNFSALMNALQSNDPEQLELFTTNISLRKLSPSQMAEAIVKALELRNSPLVDRLVPKVAIDDLPIYSLTEMIIKALDVGRRDVAHRFCTDHLLQVLSSDELDSILEKAIEHQDSNLMARINQLGDL
jgi:hypothetical protein